MTAPVKHSLDPAVKFYGVGPHWVCEFTLLGQGSGNAPIMVAQPSNPPAAATTPSCVPTAMITVANTGTGVNTLTFDDAYWAIAGMRADVDDINAATPIAAYLGQPTNLGAGLTGAGTNLVLTLSTYNPLASYAAVDVALNTPIRVYINFKKGYTGNAQ
jgi:hypothetical protein